MFDRKHRPSIAVSSRFLYSTLPRPSESSVEPSSTFPPSPLLLFLLLHHFSLPFRSHLPPVYRASEPITVLTFRLDNIPTAHNNCQLSVSELALFGQLRCHLVPSHWHTHNLGVVVGTVSPRVSPSTTSMVISFFVCIRLLIRTIHHRT